MMQMTAPPYWSTSPKRSHFGCRQRQRLEHNIMLLTHHHPDHVQGLPDILAKHRPIVIGAKADANRLPHLDQPVSDGDHVSIGSAVGDVYDVSGTRLAISPFILLNRTLCLPRQPMALGCGRLFEAAQSRCGAASQTARVTRHNNRMLRPRIHFGQRAFCRNRRPDNPALQDRIKRIEEASQDANRPKQFG